MTTQREREMSASALYSLYAWLYEAIRQAQQPLSRPTGSQSVSLRNQQANGSTNLGGLLIQNVAQDYPIT